MSIDLSFRNKITFKDVVWESNAVTSDMVSVWFQTTLPTLFSNDDLHDNFNAHKFGLLYKTVPGKTLHLEGEKCAGGNHSKVQLSGTAAPNTYGEKLQIFVMGKSKEFFSGIRHLPCRYQAQANSCVNGELFDESTYDLDNKFQHEGRKVVRIIDNFPAPRYIENLKVMAVAFLPKNATSITQPIYQDVTRSLKAKYLAIFVCQIITA